MSAETERIFYPKLKRQTSYPTKAKGGFYDYSRYREHIATDCQHRCVYCDAHADDVGGAEAMEIDHFRPESLYDDLINDPNNLHYSCGRCNRWKSNHWPAHGTDATHNGKDGFINPFTEDRLEYFAIGLDGKIIALQPPAGYMIGLLHLDRAYLKKLREKRQLISLLRKKVEDTLSRRDEISGDELAKTLAEVLELFK